MAEQEQQQVPTVPAQSDDPQKDFSAYSAALDEDLKKKGVVPDPEKADHPILDWFKRTWGKVNSMTPEDVKHQNNEIGRSMARGAIGAVKELQNTVALNAQDPIIKTAAEVGSKITSKVQEIFGGESDDRLAAFAEGVTQFTLPFVATGPLGLEAKLGSVGGAAARGAAVDYSAFDAHSGSLTDLLKLIPGDGAGAQFARQASDFLHVKEDDPEQIAKIKYAASGVIPGILVDGVIAGARLIKARAAGDAVKVAENTKILQGVADGTHVPEGSFAKVVPNEDGTFGIHPTTGEAVPEAAPKFATKEAAQSQVETINFTMKEATTAAKNAGGLTEGDANEVRRVFQRMLTSPGPVDMQKLLEGTHFNFSYMNEPKETLAMIESISEVFGSEINAAKGADGISHARQIEIANEILGSVHPDQIPAVMAQSVRTGSAASQPARLLAANFALRDVGGKAAKLFDMIESRPNDPILREQARLVARNLLDLQQAMAETSAHVGRSLEIHKAFDEMAAEGGPKAPKLKPETKPSFDSPKAKALNGKKAPKAPIDQIAGMDQREIEQVLRMAKMADGEPRNVFAIGHSFEPIRKGGTMAAVRELFVNSLLTAAHSTAATMNAADSIWRATGKMLGGAFSGNGAMMREGFDMLYEMERGFADNFKSAVTAARAGHSIINPVAAREEIQGTFGKAVRLPGKGLLAIDEFTRVANYRAYVRAKSLRFWREKGLDGAALLEQVNKDVGASFDKNTGIATIPAALKYAEGPTFSSPLTGPIGQKLTSLFGDTNAGFIAPFVKTSVNIFNVTLDRTPVVNAFLKRNRDVLLGKMGKEAAADLWTQTAMAGGVYGYAYLKAKAGEVTGRAPKDPALRALWLDQHPEYSIRLPGTKKWVSYRKGDPIFTPLGLVADAMMISDEVARAGGDAGKGTDYGYTVLAAIAATFSNKTYMQGLTQFMDAWSSGDGNKVQKWAYGLGTAFTAPTIVSQVNTDPYYREVDSFLEQTMSKYPGLSEKLPAKYNIFGEPLQREANMLSPFPVKGDVKETVASDLYEIGKGFAAPPRKVEGVDLGDRDRFAVNGVTPWDRLQELIREPGKGRPSLRDKLTSIVNTPKWEKASPGSIQYPGGERWAMAAEIIDGYQKAALQQVEREFPAFREELKLQRKLKGASFRKGQDGAEAVLDKAGR